MHCRLKLASENETAALQLAKKTMKPVHSSWFESPVHETGALLLSKETETAALQLARQTMRPVHCSWQGSV